MSADSHKNRAQSNADYRLEFIQELIIQLASGNLSYRGLISEKGDDFDAIITGINMLGEELQSSTVDRDYLNSIVEGIMDMIFILDPEFTVDTANQSTCNTLGFTENQLKGKTLVELLDIKQVEFSNLVNSLSQHKKIKNYESTLKTCDKQPVEVSLNFSRIYGKSGEEKGILVTAKEIGDLKKIQKELKRSNLELNTFIYKLSHDLRGPVSSILGLTDLVGKEMSGISPTDQLASIKDYLELIKKSSFQLDRIITNLSEVISLRNSVIEANKFKVAPIIEEVIQQVIPKAKSNDFKVVRNYSDTHYFIGDKRHLQLILTHLLENAYKYRKRKFVGAQCEICISNLKNFLLLKIIDNGKGISQQHINSVFEMFHRASADSTGSGLGLFIVKSIVDKLNGEIQIFSKLGEGTEILVFLPIEKI